MDLKSLWRQYVANEYRKTPEWQLTQLNLIQLAKPELYKPSADGALLIHWERIFRSRFGFYFYPDTKSYFDSIVTVEVEYDEEFDIGLLDCLSNSKSFGESFCPSINGSWFSDLNSWGRGMYPTHDGLEYETYGNQCLAGIDEKDWKNNLAHLSREGFGSGSDAIDVGYYSWLDRYEFLNSGGSHHCAMLVSQVRSGRFEHKRKARLQKFSLSTTPVEALISQGYYLFVASNEGLCVSLGTKPDKTHNILTQFCSPNIDCISLGSCSPNRASIFIIHQQDLAVEQSVFKNWYTLQCEMGVLIPLLDLLKNTAKYCKTPYLHEVRDITLGDPFRRSDLALRKLLNESKNTDQ